MFIKKSLYGIKFIFLTVVVIGLATSNIYAKDSCITCHKDSNFRVQNKILFDYYSRWKDSIHDLAGVTCADCHGGDQNKTDKDASHKGMSSPITSKDFYKEIPQSCGSTKCHPNVLKNFTESKHYKALVEKGKGPHCATCHGSVNSEVYYASIIAKTCEVCHNKDTEIYPEATELAEKILQRFNVSHGYKKWILIFYSDRDPAKVKEINTVYGEIANSWHKFDFSQIDEESKELLNKLKSIVNKGLAEKKKMKKIKE